MIPISVLLASQVTQAAIAPVSIQFKNWGLGNTKNTHVHVQDAWKIEPGKKEIVVAVIDTGIDAKHPALARNIWRDPKKPCAETETNSAAKQCTPVFGWNFVTDSPNPTDDHRHGTHVAGIIGAQADAATGVAGVAQNVSIMPVKYYSELSKGEVNLSNTVRAIEYAVEHGARIINYSGGGPDFSEMEKAAIRRAEEKGILFVAAAGNERQDSDLKENFYFPSAYGLSNIISVAATNIDDQLLPSSNWGKNKVDVTAPGQDIYSTLPGGHYGTMSGTSQATAFVSGIAALLLSHDPSLTPTQIKFIIKSTVDQSPWLASKINSGGRVNALSALRFLKSGQISKTALNSKAPGQNLLNWLVSRSFAN